MFCGECGKQINDKAVVCVHCGAPTVRPGIMSGAGLAVSTPLPEAQIVAEPQIFISEPVASEASTHLARNVSAAVILALIIVGLGFSHIVLTEPFPTIIPEASFTFSNTFTTVSEVVARNNSQSLGDALRGDPQFEHLVRELERRGQISSRKRTWSEVENEVRKSLPDR